MKKPIALLAVAAVLAVVLVSGCTQTPAAPSGGAGNVISKAAEDKAAAAVESELDQAVANISTSDIESSILSQ